MTKIKRRDVPNEFTQFILVKEGCGPETCESLADGIANATGQANEYPGTVVAIYRLERLVSSTRRKAKVFDPNTLREARK